MRGLLLPLLLSACTRSVPSAPQGDAKVGKVDTATKSVAKLPTRKHGPVGINLFRVGFVNSDWPFLDAFKIAEGLHSRSGSEWHDGQPLDTDAHGWVRSLKPNQKAVTLVPTYGGGHLVIRYKGQGKLTIEGQKSLLLEQPGRIEAMMPPHDAFILSIVATDSKDPIRDIQVVEAKYEKLLATQTFHPIFLEGLRSFGVIRFMDWGRTVDSTLVHWADRPEPQDATQSGERGVAIEYMLQLSRELNADPWLCVPHQADDDYIQNMAKLVVQHLGPQQKLYLEYSNEVWNDAFQEGPWVREQGVKLGLDRDAHVARLKYQSRRSVQIFKVFEAALGKERLVRVMASQISNSFNHQVLLDFEDAHRHVDALSTAPYFGGHLGAPEDEKRLESLTVTQLLDQTEANLKQALAWTREDVAVAKKYGLPLIAYEGGQHLVLHPAIHKNEKINALMDEANRHPQMGAQYRMLLEGWKELGGQTFVAYAYVAAPMIWGRWGVLERQDQPRAAAPKFNALVEFNERNPVWW